MQKKNKKIKIKKKAVKKKSKNLRKGKIKTATKKGRRSKNKKAKGSAVKIKSPQPWGVVTHYYGKIGVAIVKLNSDLAKGSNVSIVGATTNFVQTIDAMQMDHQEIDVAKKGREIGVKVKNRVREGDELFGV